MYVLYSFRHRIQTFVEVDKDKSSLSVNIDGKKNYTKSMHIRGSRGSTNICNESNHSNGNTIMVRIRWKCGATFRKP